MSERRTIILLILTIFFFGSGLVWFLDETGVIRASDFLPFTRMNNPERIEDIEFPTEVEKQEFKKWQETLMEKEESLAKKESEIADLEMQIRQRMSEIEQLRSGISGERKKLQMLTKDWEDRRKKIEDLANKVANMPPQKATEMMENWRDFDVIEVLRQMDRDSAREGTQSITPYLLTLFNPERRAEITRKMLLQPLIQEEPEMRAEGLPPVATEEN